MVSEPMELRRHGGVPPYARIDVLGGAVMILIAGLVWYGAITLNVGTIADFGAGAMPKALAIVLLLAGGAVLVQGLGQRGKEVERIELALGPPSFLVIAIALFGLFIRGGDFGLVSTPQLGLMVVGPLTVFIAGCATPDMRVKELLAMAFGLTAAVLLVFCDLLDVAIPVFPKIVQNAIPLSFGVDAAMRAVYVVYGGFAALSVTVFMLRGNGRD